MDQVYLPMSYLYGKRAVGELTPLVMSLRKELYCQDYSSIDWNVARNQCAKEDLYYPHPWYQVTIFRTDRPGSFYQWRPLYLWHAE